MLARTYTATLLGLTPMKVEVEVDGSQGTPNLIFIGLPSKATEEARERITAALQNCDIKIRSKRTVVNLAPADIPKVGSSFDLAIAVGLLKMYEEIHLPTDQTIFLGELSLDGQLKKIRGVLPLVLAAREMGFTDVVIPQTNASEVSIITNIRIHPIAHLRQYIEFGQGKQPLTILKPISFVATAPQSEICFEDILGQEQAKRALIIAAAGGHNVFLHGPPGVGKSMMAKAMTSILPPLTEAEALEVTAIYSVAGLANGLIQNRPFRSPHHTISAVGLVGGGQKLRPGEVTLAHRGVLFLDELPEFNRAAVESLRQPLEDHFVHISRVTGSTTYPALFSLIAAANPCPCGYRHSKKQTCHCSPASIEMYQKKLSGPLLDRFDLHVQVSEVEIQKLGNGGTLVTSAQIRDQVCRARQLQAQRYQGLAMLTNTELTTKLIHQFCELDQTSRGLLLQAAEKLNLSARSYFKIIKMSRTIADLAGCEKIESQHVAEALQYR